MTPHFFNISLEFADGSSFNDRKAIIGDLSRNMGMVFPVESKEYRFVIGELEFFDTEEHSADYFFYYFQDQVEEILEEYEDYIQTCNVFLVSHVTQVI